MRTIPVVITALVLAAAALPDMAAGASRRVRPVEEIDTVKIRVNRKSVSYHAVTAERPFVFRVNGPTPIRVISRLLYDGLPGDGVRYRLRMEIDGVELRTMGETVDPSPDARLSSGGEVGTLRREIVQIPAGNHKVRIYPLDEDRRIALRVFRGDGRPKTTKWVSYTPRSYRKAVRLHARDSEVIYYRIDNKTPVAMTLNGPLRIKIMSRLDFGTERGYSQTYVVKAFVDGEMTETFSLKSRASHTSTYPDLPEITPGVAREIFVDVPEGMHEVTLTLDCTTAECASLRMLIPERAVTNHR